MMRAHALLLGLASATALAAVAWAQAPTVVEPDQKVEGSLSAADPAMPDGGPHVCYAINTKAGDQIALTLHADKFAGRLSVGRGPSCTAAAIQFNNVGADGKDARVGFKAAGGRYVIAVRGAQPEAVGAFKLQVDAVLAISGQPAPGPAAAGAGAAPPSDRKAAMLAQVDKRRAEVERQRIADEQQREREAEARRQLDLAIASMEAQQAQARAEAEAEEASRPPVNLVAAFTNSFNQAMAQNQAEQAQQQQMLNNLAAQQRAAQAAREARDRAEQLRQDNARREAAQRQAEQQQALSRQLAEANAYRNSQMANADPATRQRLAQQNQSAAQTAQAIGGGQAFQQRQGELDSAAQAQRAADLQAQERQRRADQQKAADQQRAAEQQRLAEAQRRQQQAQSSAASSPSSSSSGSPGLVIAQRPPPPPIPTASPTPPRQTPVQQASASCPAGNKVIRVPEELMARFKYGRTRAEAEAELNKQQSGLYDMKCTGNDFGWQCEAKYKSGVVKEFCVKSGNAQ